MNVLSQVQDLACIDDIWLQTCGDVEYQERKERQEKSYERTTRAAEAEN
jgi:hypothetical protein